MLGNSVFLENSGGGSASDGVAAERRNDGGEVGERSPAGNQWPHKETLALLKIRSDMDQSFRDSVLKAPLWDEVSKKLDDLGYHRSANKCKEKFENIYKYHKRTKDVRSSRQNGKNYKFFEQLENLDTDFSVPMNQIPTTMMVKPIHSFSNQDHNTSTASSSEGTSKKKRKVADYFERLMKDVLKKQEDLQNKFLEALEKCEKDRIAREEAWKAQEVARIKREQELLAQERAMAAAKDAAVLAFLQKIISQHTLPIQIPDEILTPIFDKQKNYNKYSAGESSSIKSIKIQSSTSRWPKAEVEALIMLKTDLDVKYQQDNGPKGPLWEEISSCMKKLGYDRSAKRCKEKWENINKYYKRVKDSNKKRPDDSKTCPYFNMLESIYASKSKKA
ncbi:hypothetical protein RD792_006122, partial [Penstemon davidsonii]